MSASAPRSPRARSPAFGPLPTKGTVFISVANRDKRFVIFPVKRLADLGFEILATRAPPRCCAGTASRRRSAQVQPGAGPGRGEDHRPADPGRRGRPDLQHPARRDQRRPRPARRLRDPHRRGARNIPCITTVQGLAAAVQGIEAIRAGHDRRPLAAGLGSAERARCLSATPRLSVIYQMLFAHGFARSIAERAHEPTFGAHPDAGPAAARSRPDRPRTGRDTVEAIGPAPSPAVGLAAGLDKNGVGVRALGGARLRPRRARHGHRARPAGQPGRGCSGCPPSGAIVNRMGFNNDGAAALAERLAAKGAGATAGRPVLGISIGKTKSCRRRPGAVEADYLTSPALLAPYADYLAVNVSSRTPRACAPCRTPRSWRRCSAMCDRWPTPLAAPGAAPRQARPRPHRRRRAGRRRLALDQGPDGMIATNTTLSRDGLPHRRRRRRGRRAGGLSGCAADRRGPQVVRLLRDRADRTHPHRGRRHHRPPTTRRRIDAGADPAAGLHRLHLRRPAVAAAGS